MPVASRLGRLKIATAASAMISGPRDFAIALGQILADDDPIVALRGVRAALRELSDVGSEGAEPVLQWLGACLEAVVVQAGVWRWPREGREAATVRPALSHPRAQSC